MISGFVNIKKEKGMTSQRVVSAVKKILRTKGYDFGDKVGHLGTLDPDAEGVLPVAFGRATRLFDYSLEKIKVYYTIFKFGIETDTLDEGGEVLSEDSFCDVSSEKIQEVLPKLVGKVSQIPPLYSAKSVGGVRAYKLARSGVEVELKPKEVEIFSVESLEKLDKNLFSFRITCGGGTYIRSIARDMAKELGTVGIMSYLLREKSGVFEIKNAISLVEFEENTENSLLPIDTALASFEKFDMTEHGEKILNGVGVFDENAPKSPFVVLIDGKIVGISSFSLEYGIKINTRLL